MKVIASIVLLLAALALVNAFDRQNRPIIGVLTQPSSDSIIQFGPTYIAASYVKYLEGAGARVVPIYYNESQKYLNDTFNSVNGILFPGGSSDINKTQLFYAAQYLVELTKQAASKGVYVPLFGHCMGFELLVSIVGQTVDVLSPFDAENITLPLLFTSNYKTSEMFKDAPNEILSILAGKKGQNVTMNNHQWGLSPTTYNSNKNLNSFFSILSTNYDMKGVEFISTIEAFHYPIFGIQWHAEKPEYEWNPDEGINHSMQAVAAMQYMADFFGTLARKNNHKYSSIIVEKKNLIYNFDPVYTELYDPSFEQCYFF